jgi:hypothetical protein
MLTINAFMRAIKGIISAIIRFIGSIAGYIILIVIDHRTVSKRPLIVVGAITVLGTFFAKEVLRDHAHEVSTAVENAQSLFLSGRGLDGLSLSLADAAARLPVPTNTTADPWHFLPPRDETALALFRRCDNELTYLQLGLRLCEVVPKSEADKKELLSSIAYFKKIGPELRDLASKFVPPDVSGKVTATSAVEEMGLAMKLLLEESDVTLALKVADQLHERLDTLLEKAEIVRDNAVWWYKWWGFWSIVLYVVGILLWFYGQMSGIEVVPNPI